ncbi:hypothetical protein BH11ARM2_BH11ARM2_20530 [soil metagenome]
MRSIQSVTRRAFEQGLASASHHLPANDLDRESWLALTGLRYGLSTCASTHALLTSGEVDDEVWVLDQLGEVAETVSDHFTEHSIARAPSPLDSSSAWRVGAMAQSVADDYAPLVHRVPSLGLALRLVSESFCDARRKAVLASIPFLRRREGRKRFDRAVRDSVIFAEKLYERRLLDLEEVPEIALLGE